MNPKSLDRAVQSVKRGGMDTFPDPGKAIQIISVLLDQWGDEKLEEAAKVADREFKDASDEANRLEKMEDGKFINGARTKSELVASLAHEAHRAYDIAQAIRNLGTETK